MYQFDLQTIVIIIGYYLLIFIFEPPIFLLFPQLSIRLIDYYCYSYKQQIALCNLFI